MMNPFEGLTPYQAALELSRAGYHLIPVKKGDKAPPHVPWKNWQTKPTPPELIDFWEDRYPGCNWAVVCGRASGLAVIDADSPEAVKWRSEAFMFTGVEVRTAHGSHWWAAFPKEGMGSTNLRHKGRNIEADVKAEGGYVMAPQSRHPDGITVYTMDVAEGASFKDLPVLKMKEGSGIELPRPAQMEPIYEGGRDTGLASYAGTLYASGFGYEDVLSMLRERNLTCCIPPLPDRDVLRIASSIGKAEMRNHPERTALPAQTPAPAVQPEGEAADPEERAAREGLRLRKGRRIETDVPEWLVHPGGLMEDIMGFTARASVRTHPVFALAGAVAVIGTLAAQKVKGHTGLTTNVYCVALGGSGSGKDAPKQAVTRLLTAVAKELFAGSDVASDSAIVSRLAMPSARRGCYVFDEFGLFLQAAKRQNSPRAGIAKCLTELFSHYRYGDFYSKGYADAESGGKVVPWHGLCLLGLSVPEEYWAAMQDNEAVNGFLSRQLCFLWNGAPVPRNRCVNDSIPPALLEGLKEIWDIDGGDRAPKTNEDGSTVLESMADPQAVPVSQDALEYISRMEDEADRLMLEAEEDGRRAASSIYNRRAEYGLKLALIHCVSRLRGACLTEGVSLEDAEWGFKAAAWCQDAVIAATEDEMGQSNFARWCGDVENAIRTHVRRERQKGRATPGAPWRVIERALKGVTSRQLKEVQDKLKTTKRIWLCEGWKSSKASKRPLDLWCLVEEKEEDGENA